MYSTRRLSFQQRIKGIHALRYRNHAHLLLSQAVDKQCGLGSMTAKPRQVFHKDCIDLFHLNSRSEHIQPTAAEIHATDVIIGRTADDRPAFLFRKGAADFLLVLQKG